MLELPYRLPLTLSEITLIKIPSWTVNAARAVNILMEKTTVDLTPSRRPLPTTVSKRGEMKIIKNMLGMSVNTLEGYERERERIRAVS